MTKKLVEQFTPRHAMVLCTIFNGNKLIEYLFIEDSITQDLVLKISPNYPTMLINNTIVGTSSDEKFFFIDCKTGELTIIDQIVSSFEFINNRFIEVSGSSLCILFDTIDSKTIDTTEDGYIQLHGSLVKCITASSTKIYNSTTGVLQSIIPNI
jgi:hypothetical protein